MSVSLSRILPAAVATAVLVASAALPAGAPAAADDRAALAPAAAAPAAKTDPVLFFAADGMRQDLVQHYADHGVMPAMRRLLKKGASATGGGLLTQAPPNTGAGWYSLATGAWPAVTGSTNNTFHINGQPFANRTAAFDPGVLQAESIAQSAERGGKKVAQIDWAGGRGASTQGPTVDFRSFFSGRGVVTNFRSATDDEAFTRSFGLQYDSPEGFAGNAPFPQAAPAPATGWTNVPDELQPGAGDAPAGARLRRGQVRPERLPLRQHRRRPAATTTERCSRASKDGSAAVADLREGETADVKVKISGGALDGKTAGFLVKVERLSGDLKEVRLFHTSVARAIATWPKWPGATGFTGDFEEYVAQRFPSSTAADFAVLEAGVVSEETYVEQGLYWEKLMRPLTRYIIKTYQPDLVLAGYPTTDEFSAPVPRPGHQAVDQREAQPGVRRRAGQRHARTTGWRSAAASSARRTPAPTTSSPSPEAAAARDDVRLLRPRLRPAVRRRRRQLGAGRSSACCPSRRPPTAARRPARRSARRRPAGPAERCRSTSTSQGRDPAGGGLQQVAAADEASTVAAIKAAFLGVVDPNDWTGDGSPEGWKVMDRAYTKAEARSIPNGPHSTTNMAHPTRTGDVVAFAYPPYQFDAATPGTLVARSAFFGQHGYVPDVQNLRASVNMRATFLAGGPAIAKKRVRNIRTIDVAPTIAYLLRVPLPQQAQGRVRLDLLRKGYSAHPLTILGINDFHGQLDPTTTPIDGINTPVGGAANLATLLDEDAAALPKPALMLAGGDNVGASPPNSSLLEDEPAIDVENAWGLDATSYGNHEFDYGVTRLQAHQERADFPFLATNIVETATGKAPSWVRTSRVFTVNGIKVGVIGAALENTPELVSRGATEGLTFLPAAPRIKAESQRLRSRGVKVQIVVIHEGTANGANADRAAAGRSVGRPDRGHHPGPAVDHGRRGHRGAHAPGVQPDGRQDPGHRGHQRGRDVLGPAAHGPRRRRHLGRRRDPTRDHPRRDATAGRAGDRRRRERADRGAAQPGHRPPVDRHPARPDPAERVGDGQHGRRRDAGEVSGRGRRR